MGLVDGPRAVLRRLVVVESEVDSERGLLDRRGEVEVGRRVEDGVRAEDDEELHLAGGKVGRQAPGSTRAGRPGRLDRIGQENGRPDVPEVEVHRVREGVDSRGGVLARDDDASPGGRLQVGHGRGDEGGALPAEAGGLRHAPDAELGREGRAAAAAEVPRGEREAGGRRGRRPSREGVDGEIADRNGGGVGRGRPPAARELARVGESAGVLRRTGSASSVTTTSAFEKS